MLTAAYEDIGMLKAELDQLKRLIFGQKSERLAVGVPEEQCTLDDLFTRNEPTALPTAETETITITRNKKGHGRKPIPANLPRETIEVDLTDAEKLCGCCGEIKKKIGEEISEVLEYHPAQLKVKRFVRPKYVCGSCPSQGIATALLPSRVIDRGMADATLIAHIIEEKYVNHMPMYRQERKWERIGIEIARSTMVGWIGQAAELLKILHEEMRKQILKAPYLQTDESPFPVMDDEVQGKTHKGYVWPMMDVLGRMVLFDYQDGRGLDGPLNMLKGFHGYLQTDAYAVYDSVGAKLELTLLLCWAHVRRRFFESRGTSRRLADRFLELIGKLYKVESEADDADLSYLQRQKQRWLTSEPILREIKNLLDNPGEAVLPKSPIGKAIRYALNGWEKLQVFLADGRLKLDNNLCENIIRPFAIGRKNWLFAGSPEGAQRSAIIYSFSETCRLQGVNFYEWLADVLPRILDYPANRIHELLPAEWKKRRDVAKSEAGQN